MIYYEGREDQQQMIKRSQSGAKVRCSVNVDKIEYEIVKKLRTGKDPWRNFVFKGRKPCV